MMIFKIAEVRLAVEADLDAWQRFVDECPDAGCMHHAGWFRVLREAFRVVPQYMIALDDHGAIRGVLPAYLSRSRLAGSHISSLEDGILAHGPEIGAALLDKALALRNSGKAQYLQLRGGKAHNVPCLDVPTVRTIIPIRSAQAQWSAVKKKTRWAIRQAEKQPITIEFDCSLNGLDAFYHVYAQRMRDLGTPVVSPRVFHAIRTHLGRPRLRLYLIRYDKKLIGGMICILNGDRWTDYIAAVQVTPDTEFANYLLYWHVIQDAGLHGASQLDLGRSTPESGVHLFKRKWGGVDVVVPYRFYVAPDRTPRNMGLQRLKDGKGLAQRLWTQLPLPMANRLGPLLRRQLPFI